MVPKPVEGTPVDPLPSAKLTAITADWTDRLIVLEAAAKPLLAWLDEAQALVDENNERERIRLNSIIDRLSVSGRQNAACQALRQRLPVFVLFSNYFRVRPIIHLAHLAQRLASGIIDDGSYDYGNSCLLKLLGFTAQQLSDLGNASEPAPDDVDAMQAYRAKLDERSYQLNAASVQLTREICSIWNPSGADADRLRIVADGQYLKVVVEDELGVEIELDQRSEGFQWLVSFFIVFFAEAAGQHANAILLLDEPGLSLHALKQREFRNTISRLAKNNQTIYTTHSPFLVGPDELDLVRVVEMTDRTVGTKVHTTVTSSDPAALLPLQEALGYDLAQSLFSQHRNLVLEGLTDYWYVEAVNELLGNAGIAKLNDRIALIPANAAGKVVYFATILHAHNLKVATLLDSDNAGDQAAKQDTLVHKLGQRAILRTKDYISGSLNHPEIEDMLRETLIPIGLGLGWDIRTIAAARPNQSILDIFEKEVGFSKYKLAKAFLRWSRDHEAGDLTTDERTQWTKLIAAINNALK